MGSLSLSLNSFLSQPCFSNTNVCSYVFLSKQIDQYISLLHFKFLFSLFVFVSAAGHYFRIWTGSIWTGQIPSLFQIKSIIQQIVTSGHFGSYGSIWTGQSPNKYYMDLSFCPYNIFLVTDRYIYCHMTLSAMNYLLYILNIFHTLNDINRKSKTKQ